MRFRRHNGHDDRRSVLGEIGIVLLGVLLALGAEQLVTALHWRADVAQTRAAIEHEIATLVYQGYERIAVAPCLSARIVELSTKLRSGGAAWAGDPLRLKVSVGVEDLGTALPMVYRAPNRLWPSDAWRMGIADGTVARLPRDVAQRYSDAYSTVESIRAMQDDEQRLIAKMSVLGVDQTLDSATRIDLQRDLAELDQINSFTALIAVQLRDALGNANDALRDSDLRADYRKTLATQRRFRGTCVRPDKADPLRV